MKNGSETHGKGGKQTGKVTNVPSKTQTNDIKRDTKKGTVKGGCCK